MSVWIIIPVRPFGEGKSRLADTLSPIEREAFNRRMFAHVLGIAAAVVSSARILVVSRAAEVRDLAKAAGAIFLEECGHTLNAALAQAAAYAREQGATAVLSLSTDLPLLETDDLLAMLDAASDAPVCVIAPDHADLGTNALLVSPPAAIPYLYGENSAFAHRQAAEEARLRVACVRRPGLQRDVDTEEDFRAFA
ncbi:MAG: 2-phospho-L-lactate guanylyltransferase [Sphingomonadaceae bacterium]|nr:2-phospho-L-lactate guanylyltransferase [Sphingomonadaceae bacterium]